MQQNRSSRRFWTGLVLKTATWMYYRAGVMIAIVFWALGMGLACRHGQLPRYFADSTTYIHWDPIRLPMYCLFVSVFGHGTWLIPAQTVLSLTAWSVLGWRVGRSIGVAVGICLALASTVFQWNLCCLSESLSISLLALLTAQTLWLLERSGPGVLFGWVLLAAFAGLTRMTNVYVLPFFVLPLLVRGWRRWMIPSIAVLTIYVLVSFLSDHRGKGYQRLTLTDVLLMRILPDQEAAAYFSERGMPLNDIVLSYAGRGTKTVQDQLFAESPEFGRWVDENGKRVYQAWLLTHPRSVTEAWQGLLYYRIRLPWAGKGVTLPGISFRLLWGYYHLGRAPPWLWGFLALAPLGISAVRAYRFQRIIPSVDLLSAALVPVTLAMAFVSYHGESLELPRLMMPAGLLYRVTLLVGLAAWVQSTIILKSRSLSKSGKTRSSRLQN